MKQQRFYYKKSSGNEFGPFSFQQLKGLAEQGRILPTDKIRREESSNWHGAAKMQGLFTNSSVTGQPNVAAPSVTSSVVTPQPQQVPVPPVFTMEPVPPTFDLGTVAPPQVVPLPELRPHRSYTVLLIFLFIAVIGICIGAVIELQKFGDMYVIKISAEQLVSEYIEHEIASDNLYKGKQLAVTGFVQEIGKAPACSMYAVISPVRRVNGTNTVLCFFQYDASQSIKQNEKITIQGRCDGVKRLGDTTNIHLINCKTVEDSEIEGSEIAENKAEIAPEKGNEIVDNWVEILPDKGNERADDEVEIIRQQAQTEVEKFVGIAETAAEEAVNAETKVRVAGDANNDVKAAVIAEKEATVAAKKAKDAAEEAKNAAQGYDFTEIVRRATNAESRAAAAENSAREIVRKTKEKDPSYIENIDEWVNEFGLNDQKKSLSDILKYGTQKLGNKLNSEETHENIEGKISEERNRIAQKRFYCDVEFVTNDLPTYRRGLEKTSSIDIDDDSVGLGIRSYYSRTAKDATGLWKFCFPIERKTDKIGLSTGECGIILTGKIDEMKKFCDNRADYILRIYLTGLRYDETDVSTPIKYKVVRYEIRKKEIADDDWKPLGGYPFTEVAARVFTEDEMAKISNYIHVYGFVIGDIPQRVNETIESQAKHVDALIRGRNGEFFKGRRVNNFIKEKEGDKTLLHLAAGHNNILVVEYLISNGANVNARADSEQTPLHRAAVIAEHSGHPLDVAKFLIANGADVKSQDKYGDTPYAVANNVDMRDLLTLEGAKEFRESAAAKVYVLPKNLPPK